MDRRKFLAALGMGAGAAVLARPFDAFAEAGDPWFTGFHASRRTSPWLAAFEDVPFESLPRRALSVRGKVPKGLAGALYRTGPGRMERNGLRYRHWFDGDGLLHAWRLDHTGVTHEARMIATTKYEREKAAGRFLVNGAGTVIPGSVPIRNNDDLNTANTAVLAHAGSLYALWEGGSAWELDARNLRGRGAKTWRDDLAHLPFSAHPIADSDGSLWNFGLVSYSAEPQLVLWRLDADGGVRDFAMRKLPFRGYIHSFASTSRHLAFVLHPWVWTADAPGAFFDALQWQPGLGSRLIVIDKADLSKAREFELPAGMTYHWADAYESGSSVELYGCWYDDGGKLNDSIASLMRGGPVAKPVPSTLVRVRADLASGKAALERLPQNDVEFPAWDARDARASRLYMPAQRASNSANWHDSLVAVDRARERIDAYRFGDHVMVEEHRFVPATGDTGKGWLVGTSLDWKAQQTCLTVFDAAELAAGPVCEARLPHTVPLGFHGCFVAA